MTKWDDNLRTFSNARVVGTYARNFAISSGFLDAGERAALLQAAPESRGSAILDVGVGAGRTTALLRLVSDEYVAVDYSKSMVAEFARNYPDMQCECLDARDLHYFAAGRFGLIVFSNNGIDSVSHQDRRLVLSEFARLLAPRGLIVFSTLNKLGPSYKEKPFQVHRPTVSFRASPRALTIATGRRVLNPMGALRGPRNWWNARHLIDDHGEWAVGPLAAHDFGLFVHFTTLPDLVGTLATARLRAQVIYTDQGRPIGPGDDAYGVDNFTVVACKD